MIPLTHIISATVGAGAMFVLMIQPLPQPACEPLELVRFAGKEPEIHVVSSIDYGRSEEDWLQQFDHEETVATDDDESVRRHHRRRRHARWR